MQFEASIVRRGATRFVIDRKSAFSINPVSEKFSNESESTRANRSASSRIALAVVLLFSLCSAAQIVPTANAQDFSLLESQVISASELRAAGITRLSNVLMLVDGARYSTIDGFTIMPSFSGLAPVQDRLWSVEVDGLPAESGILDVQNLNALSVPISSIDSIVVSIASRVRHGRYRHGGTIEIYTRQHRSGNGYYARASLSAVNESGDPGPYRYSDPEIRLNNVDKEGPDASLDVGMTSDDSRLSAGGVMHQIIPSDPAVFVRNYQSFDTPRTPVMRVIAPFLSMSSNILGVESNVRFSGASFDDMLFSREIAREVPVRYERLGVAGSFASAGSPAIEWRTEWAWSSRQVRNDARATRIPLDWKEQSADVSTSVATRLFDHRVTGGASITYLEARSGIGGEHSSSILTPRLFGIVESEKGNVSYSMDGFVGADDSGLAAGGAMRFRSTPVPGHLIAFSVAAAQTLPSESNPVAFWAHRGLDVADNVALSFSAQEIESRSLSLDLAWRWKATKSTQLQVRSFGRRFSGLRYAERVIVADEAGFRVSARDYLGAWGSTVGLSTRLSNNSSFGEYSATFDYQTVLSGNELFYNAYDTTPRRQLRLDAVHRVSDRFSVKNTLFHYSSSHWNEFDGIETDSDYSATVPGFVRWDLAVSKRLAKDRVLLSAAVENILNGRVGFHPIGATFDRALRVQMTVAFD